MAIARDAVQVAAVGRLHIDARQLRRGSVKAKRAAIRVDPDPGSGHQAKCLSNFRWQNQPAVDSNFGVRGS